jgi:trehalose-6-phosphate synthase
VPAGVAVEARRRMRALRQGVRRHDVFSWAHEFLEALRKIGVAVTDPEPNP